MRTSSQPLFFPLQINYSELYHNVLTATGFHPSVEHNERAMAKSTDNPRLMVRVVFDLRADVRIGERRLAGLESKTK